ncbi:MAG: aminopeptidase [Candidatus Peribacteraceae bacterium]
MYTPPDSVLRAYADLLVGCALGGGSGVKAGEVIGMAIPEEAKPLLLFLQESVLRHGCHPHIRYLPSGLDKPFLDQANDKQLRFFPAEFKRAEANLLDHQISIIAEHDPEELKDVAPERIFTAMDSRRQFREWLFEKEQAGKFTWTLALYGTPAMAAQAGMSLEEYWQEIIHACYLDAKDPAAEWRRIQKEQERLKNALDGLQIKRVHVESERIDLWVGLGPNRQWLGGGMRNVPSYELFISPDFRMTEGTIFFNQPLFRYGNILRDIELTFKNGKVTKATAKEGQHVLEAMISRQNADRIGEFSLTDSRFSRISKFMANTLYDENVGGTYGNTHIALGRAYKDSYPGDQSKPTPKEWESWGYNESPEHTDIISTEDRTVTAECGDGAMRVIFKNGSFTL